MGTPLISAAIGSELETAKILLENGAKVNINEEYQYHSALQTAAVKNEEQLVQLLLKAEASPNVFGGAYGSPLCAAVPSGNLNIARQLLQSGADVNYSEGRKGTALEYAVTCNNQDFMNLFLEYNANVNILSSGRYGTPLLAAIHNDNFDNVNILLEHGSNANLSALKKEKPAQAALSKGRKNIFDALLQKDAQLSFKDQWGRGPLSTTILSKSFNLLPCLWGREDVDVNEQDAVGRTPLILAVLQGIDLVEELRDQKADIDAQDLWGRTALIYAIIHGYIFVASELITYGANLTLTDIRGRDALYWASQRASLFHLVFNKLRYNRSYNDSLQRTVNAAIALDEAELARQLLEVIDFNHLQTDDDGWTVDDTVLMYKNKSMKNLIDTVVARSSLGPSLKPLEFAKIPTGWHPTDLSPALILSSDGHSLSVSKTYQPPDNPVNPKGLALANHPMSPQKDGVYYFEVKIEHEGDGTKRYAIGFCDERTPLGGIQLGWLKTSWGYHGDDGAIFHGQSWRGTPFGSVYGEGDVVGCGVNFDRDIAFYTLNGEIIGRAFRQIRGKLYPAISVDVRMAGCAFSAKFWENGPNGNEKFVFKGSFDDLYFFEEPTIKRTPTISQQLETNLEDSYSDTDSDSSTS